MRFLGCIHIFAFLINKFKERMDVIKELREELKIDEQFSDPKRRASATKEWQGNGILIIVLLSASVFLGVYLFQKNYSSSKDEGDDPLFQSF